MNDTTDNSGGLTSPAPGGSSGAASTGSPGSGPSPGTSPSPGSDTGTSSKGGESLDFESMFSGDSPTDIGLTDRTSKPAEAVPPAPPAAPPTPPQQAQPQAPPQAPAQAPAQQPQTPRPQPQAASQGVPEGLDRFDPAQLASALTANQEALVDVLASQVFNLSPQEVEALETNIVEAIPRLMARVALMAQRSALTQMANIMPVAIQRHQTVMRQAGSAEQNFYKAWPGLDRQKHGKLVYGYTSMFRRQFPQATLQDIVAHVGPMVMAAARIPIGTAPGTSAAPRTNGRQPPPNPFVPAGGGGPVPGGKQSEMSPWEAMFAENG